MRTILFSLLFLFAVASLAQAEERRAAVAMPDAFSAEVAAQILQSGGNAVDAAVAAQFVLAVTLPEAGNIGGGGFMLIHKDGEQEFLDYREVAPAAAHRDMYLDDDGEVVPDLSLFGSLASGVPGTVQGMWQAHQRHGSMPWAALVQPAVTLAEKGFVVPEPLAREAEEFATYVEEHHPSVNFSDYFGELRAGKLFRQPELATTLARIRDRGAEGFYRGETARLIADFMRDNGGLITEKDLLDYRAKWRRPLMADWRGYRIVSAPPPSSGGIAVIQWLKMYDRVRDGVLEGQVPTHNSAEYVHLLAEVGKRVFADRAEYLGDPDFHPVPVARLLDDDYLAQRSRELNLAAISPTPAVVPGLPESEETTHFSIVDRWGNAVSNTTTINLSFGSGVVVEGAGFLLNDEMDDFSAKPGVPNAFGALGGAANAVHPGKRMLSSMSPTMLLENGAVKMVTGSPGGTTIITSVYQSMLNVVEFGMDAQRAVDTPRFHHQLWPRDHIRHQGGLDAEVNKTLQAMGYQLEQDGFGDLQVIVAHGDELEAASQSSGRGVSRVLVLPEPVRAAL
ncbi:gamma-glutamyltranspeptidase / glutathione hydrolase [Microbulbifer donghaiensis]|uniref:Glutathione hydrolase proenzyme n=1 Tax=Microbulbifer donghaiensis TaxID=494016 RepID=A0A1M5CFW8_9GAMM|nr:gamma-glutamyltransferase [Microbulbifer donghaiensis]SHF53628.1 gamma-glutamyltranspeptidase / glutathione hydrolase [Microbulbifer donghaiensis]